MREDSGSIIHHGIDACAVLDDSQNDTNNQHTPVYRAEDFFQPGLLQLETGGDLIPNPQCTLR